MTSNDAPEVIVSITRYTVSVLPADDINHRHYALHVELKPDGWIVGDGHRYYHPDGSWQPGQGLAHRFADCEDALAVAREAAPEWNANGLTATDVYHRTHPTTA